MTNSENVKHALESGLCGYAQPVIQYKLDKEIKQKILIEKFISIAEAQRKTKYSTNYIKNICNKVRSPYDDTLWEWDK